MPPTEPDKKLKAVFVGVLVLLVLVLLMLVAFALRDFHRAEGGEQIEEIRTILSNQRRNGPLSNVETGDIAGWMTFDYVNYLFALPPQYLATTVPIRISSYPHLSLNSYARHSGQSKVTVTQAVQAAVKAYLR